MHELAVTESILSQVLAEAGRRGAARVSRIKLRIGEGRSIVPECVRFYFAELSKGTKAARAEIEFESVPLRIVCTRCRAEIRDLVPICECRAGVEILSGQELEIEYIEIDTRGPRTGRRRRG
jgi:hydrogenase nickel incorporation protein HypA/HybF